MLILSLLGLLSLCWTEPALAAAKIIDEFTRADNADIGTEYDNGYTGHAALKIVSNEVQPAVLSTDATESFNGTVANDQWARATIGTWTDPGLSIVGVLLRAATPATVTMYRCLGFRSSPLRRSSVDKYVAGVYTELAWNNTDTWATGDQVYCTVRGTTITMYHVSGSTTTQVLTATDAAIASGRPGLTVQGVNAGQAAATAFSAGDFSASSLSLLGVGQ